MSPYPTRLRHAAAAVGFNVTHSHIITSLARRRFVAVRLFGTPKFIIKTSITHTTAERFEQYKLVSDETAVDETGVIHRQTSPARHTQQMRADAGRDGRCRCAPGSCETNLSHFLAWLSHTRHASSCEIGVFRVGMVNAMCAGCWDVFAGSDTTARISAGWGAVWNWSVSGLSLKCARILHARTRHKRTHTNHGLRLFAATCVCMFELASALRKIFLCSACCRWDATRFFTPSGCARSRVKRALRQQQQPSAFGGGALIVCLRVRGATAGECEMFRNRLNSRNRRRSRTHLESVALLQRQTFERR